MSHLGPVSQKFYEFVHLYKYLHVTGNMYSFLFVQTTQ